MGEAGSFHEEQRSPKIKKRKQYMLWFGSEMSSKGHVVKAWTAACDLIGRVVQL
jgi:hypothetical protein